MSVDDYMDKFLKEGTTGDPKKDEVLRAGYEEGMLQVERVEAYIEANPFDLREFVENVKVEALELHRLFIKPKYLVIGFGLYSRMMLEVAHFVRRDFPNGIHTHITADSFNKGAIPLTFIVVGDNKNFNFEVVGVYASLSTIALRGKKYLISEKGKRE